MKQLKKIYDLQTKCMTEIYNLLHTKKDKTIDLEMFPFYVVYATGDDTISVRINKVSLNENGDLIMSGSDTFNNEYEFDEGSDIISFATFDMYNAICQKEALKEFGNVKNNAYICSNKQIK